MTETHRPRLTRDISFGHLGVIASVILSTVIWGVRLEGRVDQTEQRQDDIVERVYDDIADIKRSIDRLTDTLIFGERNTRPRP